MGQRGRPRSFDRDAAVRSALRVFWARGYDGATLDELLDAMGGLTPPSFYAAFGSKEELFCEVVELYQRTVGDGPRRALEASPVRAAFDGVLRASVDTFENNDVGRGCLVMLAAPSRTRTNVTAHERLKDIRCQSGDLLQKRLERAIKDGELSPSAPVDSVAAFYSTVLHGLALRARDGAPHRALIAAVDGAMAAWDTLIAAPPKRTTKRKARAQGSQRRAR